MWSNTAPTEPGNYEFRCDETGYTETLTVYDKGGCLFVDCPDLGRYVVQHYHDGLTNPRWKKL